MNLSKHPSNWVAPPEHSWEAGQQQLTADILDLPLASVQEQLLLVLIKQECFSPWDPVLHSSLFTKGNRELPMTMQKPAQLLETVYHSSQSMVVSNGISRWEIRTQFYLDLKGYFFGRMRFVLFYNFSIELVLLWFPTGTESILIAVILRHCHLSRISKTSPLPTRPSALPTDPPFCYLFSCEPIDFSLTHLCDADFGSIHWSVVGSTVGTSLETMAALLPEYLPFTDFIEKQTAEIGSKRARGVVLHDMII